MMRAGPPAYGPGPGPAPAGPPQGPDDNRNLILAIVLAMAVMFGYDFFFAGPMRERQLAAQKAERAEIQRQIEENTVPAAPVAREVAVQNGPRIRFDTPSIDGTINLTGARFDDLSLKNYRRTIALDSGEVALLNPTDAEGAFDSYFGWEDGATGADIVGARSVWSAPAGAVLTPQTPLTLTYAGDGVRVTRTIRVDDDYLFTVTDVVANEGASPRTLRPFAVVRRRDLPPDFVPNQIVHQGMAGALGPDHLFEELRYQDAQKHARAKARGEKQQDTPALQAEGPGGWLGISDHFWLAALVPAQNETIRAQFDATQHPSYTDFRSAYQGSVREIAPGAQVEYVQHLFAGAKRVDLLRGYQERLGVPKFDQAVDWGMFFFLTRPFFWLLDTLGKFAGNFGVGILLTTVVVKLALFPLVNSSYAAMAKMRKAQPKMKEIQDKFAADKARQQQEMMKLYQQEKINPVSGCLPILLQIPVFYALYKVLTVTIEMRHTPFFGWIQDLSARDPTNIFNLFGLLPFEPQNLPLVGPLLWLGILPILYGVTMWATQSLSAPPGDPIQQRIFALLPIVFTFMFAGFAAGLVLYWTWSNILTVAQQYVIMRRNGVETELDKFIAKRLGRAPA